MRSLAFWSFLGLMAFIGFSNFSHADGYGREEDYCDVNDCEVYENSDDRGDVTVNTNIHIHIDQQGRQFYPDRIATVPQVIPIVPVYPIQRGLPLCTIRYSPLGGFQVLIGNRVYQDGVSEGVALNTAWFLVRKPNRECAKGF